MGYRDYLNTTLQEGSVVHRPDIDIPETFDKQKCFDLESTGRRYDYQFFSMYQYRLNHLKRRVDEIALEKWGNGNKQRDNRKITYVDKILNITSNQVCWVSGTVFVAMNNKSNIFKDVENGTDNILPDLPKSYVGGESQEITVMLEDESGRAILHGEDQLKLNVLVTGTIVAILGIELQAGIFEILDVAYPKVSPQRPLKLQTKGKIAFVSGLEISSPQQHSIKLELLKEFIQGTLSSRSQEISHLIIAGNSIKEMERDMNEDYHSLNNYGTKNTSKFNPESFELFGKFINDIMVSCGISILPGASDPTDICLPQQALHKSFFMSSKNYVGSNIKTLTNPAWLEIGSLRMLGTSGQNIDDIIKYLPEEDITEDTPLAIMESTMRWQNIAPTAPDTLYCYPFDNYDPFTLVDETPKVYFVGNQAKFQTKLATIGEYTVRLLSLPKFSDTGEIVLLDNQLVPEVIKIDI